MISPRAGLVMASVGAAVLLGVVTRVAGADLICGDPLCLVAPVGLGHPLRALAVMHRLAIVSALVAAASGGRRSVGLVLPLLAYGVGHRAGPHGPR